MVFRESKVFSSRSVYRQLGQLLKSFSDGDRRKDLRVCVFFNEIVATKLLRQITGFGFAPVG